jgi:hypothetical protein
MINGSSTGDLIQGSIKDSEKKEEKQWFNIPIRRAFFYITPQVLEGLKESGIKEGLAFVNAKAS